MIGERIKHIRKLRGLTQKAFADLLSTSSGYISEIEQGKKMPGTDIYLSLKREIGLSVDWLLTGVGEPYKESPNDEDRYLTQEHAQSRTGIQTDLLSDIIYSLEKGLQEHDLVLDPEKKAEVISLLYESYTGTEKKIDEKTVGRYLRLVT